MLTRHQTWLTTCRLMMMLATSKICSHNLLKYVRPHAGLFAYATSNHEYQQHQQIQRPDTAITSNYRGQIGAVSGKQRHLSLFGLHSICMKMEKIRHIDLPQM